MSWDDDDGKEDDFEPMRVTEAKPSATALEHQAKQVVFGDPKEVFIHSQTLLALLADWRKLKWALRMQCECVDVDGRLVTCAGCAILENLNVRD